MNVLRFADRVASRWKNGGGVTWEYAVHPPGAGLDDFFWRISRARVVGHGAFSVFPGIDRSLTVVDGDAIDLLMTDRRVRLDRTTPPYRFPADQPIECRVPTGPIEDLNVMTRRGHWTHRVARHAVTGATRIDLDGDVGLIVALARLRVETETGGAGDLEPGDAALFETATTVALSPRQGMGEAIGIRLDHVAHPWA